MPSKDELNQMYLNRYVIGGFANNSNYWSSTESGASFAYGRDFSNGISIVNGKLHSNGVRAIRAFGNMTISGCTDSTSLNYNPLANTDDGSCIFPPFTGAIGDTYQGGIVFWLDGNGGGLIAAPSDQSSGAQWGCYGTYVTGADGTAIGTGTQNTIDIINANCTSNNSNGSPTAADICANLTLGGYSDWFLPSKGELYEMFLNKAAIGGFASNYYWSSTEVNSIDAWVQSFTSGYQYGNGKYLNDGVRAVRAF